MFKKLVACGLIASILTMPGIALAKSRPSKLPIRNNRPAHHQMIKHSAPKIHHKAPAIHHRSVKSIHHHNNHRPVHYHHHSFYRPYHHHSHGHSLHSGDYAVIAAGVILGAILANS